MYRFRESLRTAGWRDAILLLGAITQVFGVVRARAEGLMALSPGADAPSSIPAAPNLAKDGGFEEIGQKFPAHWRQVDEDTTVPWRQKSYAAPDVGVYSPAQYERGNAHTGAYSIRCAATVGQLSGVTQRVYFNQDVPRAVQIGAWCKTENVIPSNWCDLALVNIRYADGTLNETSWNGCFLPLGDTPHDWEYRSRTFAPAKPIRYVDVRVSIHGHMGEIDFTMPIGSESTGLLWVDDIYVGEIGADFDQLGSRGLVPPIQTLTAFPSGTASTPATAFPAGAFQFTYGAEALEFSFTGTASADGSLKLYLATHDEPAFDHESVASFFRITLPKKGNPRLDWAFERAERGFASRDAVFYLDDPRPNRVIYAIDAGAVPRCRLTVPYTDLNAVPQPGAVWRFNLVYHWSGGTVTFASGPMNQRRFARLVFDRFPVFAIAPESFGLRPTVPFEQNPWVTRTETYWGDNILTLQLINRALEPHDIVVRVTGNGIVPTERLLRAAARKTIVTPIPYRAEKEGLGEVRVEVKSTADMLFSAQQYPLCVPPGIEFRPGQRYFYPNEEVVNAEGQVLMHGDDVPASLALFLVDLRSKEILRRFEVPVFRNAFIAQVDVTDLRINEDPLADYALVARAPNGVEAKFPFGRLRQPTFDPLPAVERVGVDDDGMLLVNGKRFFPIVSSLNVKDLRKGHADSSAMGCNVSKHNFTPPYDDARDVFDTTWSLNTYEAPCLSGHPPEAAEQGLFPTARHHPAFLFTVAAEVYRQPTPLDHYRRCAEAGQRPVLYEYYNCGCWFDTVMDQDQGGDIAMFPVCVKKAPLTRLVSQILSLERAAAQRPRSLFISLPIAISRDSPLDLIRCTVYLAVVNRANGIYMYMTDYPGADGEQIAMMRGLVLELRRLTDVILAPPTPQTIVAYPENAGIEFLEREFGGKRYLLAVNPTRSTKTVRISSRSLTPANIVRVRFELPRELTIQGNSFSDEFAPCSVHVYEIS